VSHLTYITLEAVLAGITQRSSRLFRLFGDNGFRARGPVRIRGEARTRKIYSPLNPLIPKHAKRPARVRARDSTHVLGCCIEAYYRRAGGSLCSYGDRGVKAKRVRGSECSTKARCVLALLRCVVTGVPIDSARQKETKQAPSLFNRALHQEPIRGRTACWDAGGAAVDDTPAAHRPLSRGCCRQTTQDAQKPR